MVRVLCIGFMIYVHVPDNAISTMNEAVAAPLHERSMSKRSPVEQMMPKEYVDAEKADSYGGTGAALLLNTVVRLFRLHCR